MWLRVTIAWLCGVGALASAAHAQRIGAIEPRLDAEPSRSPASWQTRLDYSRLTISRPVSLPVLRDVEVAERLQDPEPGEPYQIGFGRELPPAYRGDLAAGARWSTLSEGSRVASFSVRSPDARSLRLAIRATLPAGARIRFFDPANPDGRFPLFKRNDFLSGHESDGTGAGGETGRLRWSPTIPGDTVGVEIEIPPPADPAEVSFRMVRVSHIGRSPANRASSGAVAAKSAGSCEPVEAVCRNLPDCPDSAVAVMSFTDGEGLSFVCTGTAVNSTRSDFANRDNPFVLTANHCIASQAVAETLETDWRYEYQACGGTALHRDWERLQRGADLVAGDPDTDSTLLQLRDSLPGSACLAGWDAQSDWPADTEVFALHHPGGGVKEWAAGNVSEYQRVGLGEGGLVDTVETRWAEGATRPGSSGSGLFLRGVAGDEPLIGVLAGGPEDCTLDNYGRFALFFANQAGIHLLPSNPPPPDDHGGAPEDATGVFIGSVVQGRLDEGVDADVFRIYIAEPGTLTVYTTGILDTFGRLKREDGSTIYADDDGGHELNFRLEAEVAEGTYFVKVTGYEHHVTGDYRLHVEFVAASAARQVLVPLFLSASALERDGRQGFVRVFNRSGRSGEVRISATDDSGARPASVTLEIGQSETRPFNSGDLENGNRGKGLSGGIGAGNGDWRLRFDSALDIEVAAYIRTEDGFLTAMHDQVVVEDGSGAYHVPLFNPASNREQRSLLRLINPDLDDSVQVKITAFDDRGEPGDSSVQLRLSPGQARTLNAGQLEEGGEDLSGSLGAGAGKWRLFVEAEGDIHVVNLLDSRTGNLTNLSLPGGDNYR